MTPTSRLAPSGPEPQALCEALLIAAETGDSPLIEALLAHGADPRFDESSALALAVEGGHIAAARRLLPLCDPLGAQRSALRAAAYFGRAELLELLIPASAPKPGESPNQAYLWALESAIQQGNLDCARRLLPLCDPKENHSSTLCRAANGAGVEAVLLLLPVSDASSRDHHALRLACARADLPCAEALLAHAPPPTRVAHDLLQSAQAFIAVGEFPEPHRAIADLLLSYIEAADIAAATPAALSRKPSPL